MIRDWGLSMAVAGVGVKTKRICWFLKGRSISIDWEISAKIGVIQYRQMFKIELSSASLFNVSVVRSAYQSVTRLFPSVSAALFTQTDIDCLQFIHK